MDESRWLRLAAACPPCQALQTPSHVERWLAPRVPGPVDLMVLPLRCPCGHGAEPPDEDLGELARRFECYLVVNVDLRDGSNASILFDRRGGQVGRYLKSHALPHEPVRRA